MKDIPLTLDEYEEYQQLERKILPLKSFFKKIGDQAPKFLCCFWNFEMEEYFLRKHNFVLCIDDILRPTEEVIVSLSKNQLLTYKKNLERSMRSGKFQMPEWTGNIGCFQPKLRPSWDDKFARKYLRRILLKTAQELGAEGEGKSI